MINQCKRRREVCWCTALPIFFQFRSVIYSVFLNLDCLLHNEFDSIQPLSHLVSFHFLDSPSFFYIFFHPLLSFLLSFYFLLFSSLVFLSSSFLCFSSFFFPSFFYIFFHPLLFFLLSFYFLRFPSLIFLSSFLCFSSFIFSSFFSSFFFFSRLPSKCQKESAHISLSRFVMLCYVWFIFLAKTLPSCLMDLLVLANNIFSWFDHLTVIQETLKTGQKYSTKFC